MKNIIIGILSALLVFTFFYSKNQVSNLQDSHLNQTNALIEEVEEVQNKLDETSYKVTTLESENIDFLKQINSKDSTIIRLQDLVNEYEKDIRNGGSIVVITDTVEVEKRVVITDSNTFNYKDRWINLSGIISDSLQFKLGIKNNYSVVIGYEKTGLFKKKPYTLVTNLNPYSEVKQIKSFSIKNPIPKWSLGFTGGYGIVYNQGALVPGLGIMFGFNYRIL